jgi:hypothetical protein
LPGKGTKMVGDWRGWSLRGSAYTVWPVRKRLGGDVTVGSLPLELGESWGSSCLACCYGSPASQAERSWRKVPLSCVEDFSVKWVLGKQSRDSRSTWVTWPHQDWGILFFTASLSYHAPWFGKSTGLCALWSWIPPSRTSCPGFHCGTQAEVISGAHTEHLISWCAASRLAREEGGYMEAQTTVYLTSLLIWPAGYISPWQQMFEEITWIHQCFLVFMKFWCCWKILYLDESPEIYLHQNT